MGVLEASGQFNGENQWDLYVFGNLSLLAEHTCK